MSKQEEIREGIARMDYIRTFKVGLDLLSGFAGEVIWGKAPSRTKTMCFEYADKTLDYLHSQGVVIKVDRELPSSLADRIPLLKAILDEIDYVAVEPLVDTVKLPQIVGMGGEAKPTVHSDKEAK